MYYISAGNLVDSYINLLVTDIYGYFRYITILL